MHPLLCKLFHRQGISLPADTSTSAQVVETTQGNASDSGGMHVENTTEIVEQHDADSNPVEALVASAPISSEVRFSRFAADNTVIFSYLLDCGYTSYTEMPLPTGLHDYIPDCCKYQSGLFNHFARNIMNLETEVMCVRFHILEHYGHRLISEKPAKDIHLESLTHFMLNLFLNKSNCPINFWVPDVRKGKI